MRFSKQNHSRIPMPGKPGTCRLQVRDLGVTLEGESILRDITFQLNCREIMALIGPNGAGKSSLFRSILGQIPYSGSIQFQLAGGYPSHPKIGYVPQSPSFDRGYPISVLDFFAAAISRWPVFLPVPGHLRDKVTECLARRWSPFRRFSFWTSLCPGSMWGESICCWICWTRSGRNMISPSSSPPTISPPCAIMLTRSSSFSRPF